MYSWRLGKMKRRHSKPVAATSQPKISRFFSLSKVNETEDVIVPQSGSSYISKSHQIAVPFPITSPEKSSIEKSNLFTKLKQFVQNDDEGNEEGRDHVEQLNTGYESIKNSTNKKIISLLEAKKLKLKLTPLERQVVDVKEENPDMLLIVECGYKYRIFGEDAETAGQALKMGVFLSHNFLSCSFPTHRLYIHIKRLVSQGYKVGVVQQLETAALKVVSESKHKPFKRGLSDVYTKATFIDEPEQHELENTELCVPLCIVFICEGYTKTSGQVQIGAIALFTQDSDIVYDHFEDNPSHRTGLDRRFTHWQPAEVVLPSSGISQATLDFTRQFCSYKSSYGDCVRTEFVSGPYTDCSSSLQLLSEAYASDAEIIEIINHLPPVIVCCLAMTYRYLQEFKMDRLLQNIRSMKTYSESRNYLQMDGNTIRNLDLVNFTEQNKSNVTGTLYHFLNKTRTKFGARLLRSWILKPLIQRDQIEARQEAVGWFLERECDPEMADLKKSIKGLPDLEKKLTSILHERLKPRDFYPLCLSWRKIRDQAARFYFHYQEELQPYFRMLMETITGSLELIDSYLAQVNESMAKAEDKTKLFTDLKDYPKMAELNHKIEQVEKQLQALKPSICKILGLMTFDYVTVSGVEYLVQVKNDRLRVVPNSWMKVSATKQCARFRTPEVDQLFQELCRLRCQLKEAADEAWLQFLRDITASCYIPMKNANTAIATLDVLLAFADVAKTENFVKPTIVEGGGSVLDINHGRHPVIARLMQDSNQEYVPNDTQLSGDNKRCMIITGPNMGGKSCYLSQVAIIVVMAQMGSFVPATQVNMSILKSIFIRMGLHDEIYAGRSTFFVEMMETSSILQGATAESLVIIDELGRGTGTHDGSAIAYASLEYLVTQLQSLTLFVTHYPAVVQLADRFPQNVANRHMGYILDKSEDSEGGSKEEDVLVFLYTLTEGACPKSFGLNVARLAGLEQEIVHKARIKADYFLSVTEELRRKATVKEFKDLFRA